MRGWVGRIALLLALLAPTVASSDNPPQVVLATPGEAGGAINRFTLRFSEAMVPLGDPRAAAPATDTCPGEGEGRWVDERTWVFDFAAPLAGGTECRFELRPRLASAAGRSVAGQRAFAVDAGGPRARAVLPRDGDEDIEEDQVFLVAANMAVDRRSVAASAYCAVDGIGEKIAVDLLDASVAATVLDGTKGQWPSDSFLDQGGVANPLPKNAADRARALANVVALKCRRPLPPGHDMALVWGGSIRSPSGKTAGADQRFDFTVRKEFTARFTCSRTNPQAGCSPVEPASVAFTAPIPHAQAAAIRLTFADGTTIAPSFEKDDEHRATVSSVSFKAPLPASATAHLTLPTDVRDESGRPLANASRFPLEITVDAAPPLVKFAATFGILEAQEGGVLPVTVRAVEPQLGGRVQGVGGAVQQVAGSDGLVADWLRRLEGAERDDMREEGPKGNTHTVNHTREAPLLAPGAGRALKVALPGKGRDFEVVGIPLGKAGFYVVELASPTLGRALLGRPNPRYVATGALVTNMSVHFKWGRAASLAWVTALDSGKPVAGAEVRVTDSCSGRTLAAGTSDASGRFPVPAGLPAPETYGSCEGSSPTPPLMVSARKAGDFSFTLTGWGEGIRPFDFELQYGWSAAEPIFRTVFDRTLIRQGETVNMKHVYRMPVARGFHSGGALEGTLKLTHSGSGTSFELPVKLGADGIGETSWTAPKGAPLGDYDLVLQLGDRTVYTGQSVRVDEFRLPTMRASVTGPKSAAVKPKRLPVDLYVGYLSGGGAANAPVSLRTAFERSVETPKGWDGWSFGGRALKEGTQSLDGDGEEAVAPLPPAQTLPVSLDAQGSARSSVEMPALDDDTTMTVEMDYQDANGETLTAATRIPVLQSAVRLGVKTDGWIMKQDDLRLKLVALAPDGRRIAGQSVKVALYSREILSARRRLIGGFYAFDNNARTTKLSASCSATTDKLGLAECALDPGTSGEIYAVATTTDADGNVARAVNSVWLAGDDEWWFGGDNGDRMDVIPEATDYKAGDTARFQVRMPFRSATALVTVEREGVLSSFVTTLSGKDPVVEVKLDGAYAPDVYVSVMAVRGRIGGWRLWLADLARRWHLPFFSREGASPTALVDLAKPSYRLGIAKVNVGWEASRLKVDVAADRATYHVRDTAQVAVQVRGGDGRAPQSAEIAFAAVDEALLQLSPNPSWDLLDAMMGDRPLSVLTSTAQTQVVGKRHYGRKAVAAGGGGGGDLAQLTREDFRPVLLWRGRVPLDAQGRARVAVPLSDSLSSFKLVAIATAGADRFGTGSATVRTVQDLTIYPSLPPVVRVGDEYGAAFTLRNGSNRPMTVTATAETMPRIGRAPPITVTIPAGHATAVTWHLPAPAGPERVVWTVRVAARDGRAQDAARVEQRIIAAVPEEVWAGTLLRLGAGTTLPIAPPAGALPGRGGVDIHLAASLAPPMAGVERYMRDYPFGCFEQRLSKAVALSDAGAWNRLAGEIPAYLDGDGLLRYWPDENARGSEALTAYALSLTAEAGLAIPAGDRQRMIDALVAVVEGRLERETPWSGDRRTLRLAALAALARNGAATPELLARNDLGARDMPTGALLDWLVAIDRTRADPARRAEAEAVLRTRLAYEGTRLDLVDAANAPWWMMSSGDEIVARLVLATAGRPGWADDAPRMMAGFALRQLRGHWDTTTANAWGTLAARRFAAAYPAGAGGGTVLASLGATRRPLAWPMTEGASTALPLARAPLLLAAQGGAQPWATVQVRAAVPLLKPLFAGYRVARAVSVVQRRNPGRLTRGDVLRVRLTVDAGAERNWVVVADPIPAGATIVGTLGGQSAILASGEQAEGLSPSYVERAQDGFRGYFEWVPRGRFVVEYTVRLNAAGRFHLPPTRVEAMYSPAIRAQLPNADVAVAAR